MTTRCVDSCGKKMKTFYPLSLVVIHRHFPKSMRISSLLVPLYRGRTRRSPKQSFAKRGSLPVPRLANERYTDSWYGKQGAAFRRSHFLKASVETKNNNEICDKMVGKDPLFSLQLTLAVDLPAESLAGGTDCLCTRKPLPTVSLGCWISASHS